MGVATYTNGTTPDSCIVGAGFAGLLAGIQLKRELGIQTFTIFDENEDVGGTWLVNTYPGCACDVQSHLYSYSFEPNPYWSHIYSPQQEIWTYLHNVAKKYDLYRSIEFRSQVKRIEWDEGLRKWRVDIYNKVTKTQNQRVFDLVINSPGGLRVPQIPPEFNSFKGPMVHTATWDSTLELENKVIGVIGSGASAIQLIPELATKAKELHCYQRQPAWNIARVQFPVPAWVQFLFAYVPLLLVLFRCLIFFHNELLYYVFIGKSKMGRLVTWWSLNLLRRQVPEDKLRRDLTPQYQLGCKRITISLDYFPTMRRPNVKLHRESILQVKGHSIVTSNGEQSLDVLILATGYQAQNYFAPMEIIGKNAVNLKDKWKNEKPANYYGIMVADCPNLLFLLGPNSGLGHNSIIFMLECQMAIVIQLIRELIQRNAKVIDLKVTAEETFTAEIHSAMKKTVWGQENCGSWYADAKGQVTTLWPYSCLAYWRRTRVPDFTQFNFN